MQIRGSHIECIQQHFVQKLDNRRVFNFCCASIRFFRRIFDGDVIKSEIASTIHECVHRLARGFGGRFYQSAELVILRNNPVDPHLGSELDFFCSFLVRRVGGCNDQSVISFAQNHHAICLAYLVIQQFFGQAQRINGVQIEQRCAKDRRYRMREIRCRNSARTRQFSNETGPADL